MATTGTQGSGWQDNTTGASGGTTGSSGMGTSGSSSSTGMNTGSGMASASGMGNRAYTGSSSTTDAATATVDKIASGAHQAVDRIASAATSAASQFGVKGEDFMMARDRVVDYVRTKPVTALGIALAAGFIIARITR